MRFLCREACGEARLTVTVGQAVLVSKSEGSWAHGRGPPANTFEA